MNTDNNPDRETLEQWHKDPNNWIWGIFYFNPKDKRLLPPKKIMWMGWTVNFANPYSILVLIIIVAAIGLFTNLV
jgi:uncharacterized membrane protein